MPVKLRLEFMSVIRPDLADPKWELLDNVVHEVYGIGLRVLFIDFQGTHAHGVIDCRVLEPANRFSFFTFECQEFDVHLDMMPRDLFLIPLRVNLSHAGAERETV